ncbi:MAG: DNA alkylation repair protein [Candidatus Obscuribacterales bacterium]|nr:DNA alkylation repair protein [Candidatus Obscuribacterales bacterium]
MAFSAAALSKFIQSEFKRAADTDKAPAMAAYMKTEMPFYGIQKPARALVYREMKKRFIPSNRQEYEAGVRALWANTHREDKYAAIEFARQHAAFVRADSLKLYEELVRDGAWWDLVDDIAQSLVGEALRADRTRVKRIMDKWIKDEDMWIRRTAILSHNRHKAETDEEQLFRHCLLVCDEKEFFIRKAIGWALRNYSYTSPKSVKQFIKSNQDVLSPLSIREGLKQIERNAKSK